MWRQFIFIVILTRVLDVVSSKCENGVLGENVVIEGNQIDCYTRCDGVQIKNGKDLRDTSSGENICQFRFDQIIFKKEITKLKFIGNTAFRFIASNYDIDIKHPLKLGGDALIFAKEYRHAKILGGFHGSTKATFNDWGKDSVDI